MQDIVGIYRNCFLYVLLLLVVDGVANWLYSNRSVRHA